MIFEQAFVALPEFLVGTGFTRYDAEGTLVMAYAMSVLQELNGRNVNNPVSLVNAETPYPNTNARTADLHLNYLPVGTLNHRLAAFGIREQSWLEAKFFRKNGVAPTLDTLKGAYALLRDLLRLCVFPPEVIGGIPRSGRFLLHVYEGPHIDHLAMERNTGVGGRQKRSWLNDLHKSGTHSIAINDLASEPPTFATEVGDDLRMIDLTITVTTTILCGDAASYSLYLTRIDLFKLAYDNKTIELTNTTSTESTAGAWDQLRSVVDKQLQK